MRLFRRDALSRRLRARLEEHTRTAERVLSHLRHDAGGGRESVALMMGGERVAYLEQADVDALPSIRLVDEEDDRRKVSIAIACATGARGSSCCCVTRSRRSPSGSSSTASAGR
jgi:hypothetical protein